MRKWYKYTLDSSLAGRKRVLKDRTYYEHARSMGTLGGYDVDDAYKSKQNFFNKYFFNYHLSRLEYYHIFLEKYLSKEEEILSVGSGRCANELYLAQEGYNITCSDLKILNAYKATVALFPNFKYIEYDILSGPADCKYDAIISLGLIYLFDEKELLRFFINVSESLKIGGHLVLDSAGSSDNLLSYTIHEVILKYETMLRRIVRFISEQKWYGLIVKDFGYRRTDKEIIDTARKANLELTDQENYAFLTEFSRSCLFYLLNKALRFSSNWEKLITIIGKNIPYIRMFNFKKLA